MKPNQRKMTAAALILLALTVYTGRSMAAQKTEPQLTNRDFIRFHVIADSDTPEDQALKLKVRDGVLKEVNRWLLEYTVAQASPQDQKATLTLEQSRGFIRDHLKDIEREACRILRTNGCDHPVAARLMPRYVPEKTYDNVTFPAGEYESLDLVIGSGGGENWWCVLFPPLCLVGAEPLESAEPLEGEEPNGGTVTARLNAAPGGDLTAAGILAEPKYGPLAEAFESDEPVRLKLKFKTLEWLDGTEP